MSKGFGCINDVSSQTKCINILIVHQTFNKLHKNLRKTVSRYFRETPRQTLQTQNQAIHHSRALKKNTLQHSKQKSSKKNRWAPSRTSTPSVADKSSPATKSKLLNSQTCTEMLHSTPSTTSKHRMPQTKQLNPEGSPRSERCRVLERGGFISTSYMATRTAFSLY